MKYIYLLFFALFFSFQSLAHQLSTSYIALNNETDVLTGSWQVALADIEPYIAFDVSGNGEITWDEVMINQQDVADFTLENIIINKENLPCPLLIDPQLQLDKHFNQSYLVIFFESKCQFTESISLRYNAFFNQDANHKAIVHVTSGNLVATRVFTEVKQNHKIDLKSSSNLQTFTQYSQQGILHIWFGIDHVLFLLALLLTCVLSRKEKQWQAIKSKKLIFKETAILITAFTLAHSITLTMTALDLMNPSSRWVELSIALSVLFAALNNIWPVVLRLGWVTFAFGLLHGMGFASVLGELGLATEQKLLSVLSFNFGVELGQLTLLALILPLLMAARDKTWYQKWVMPTSSTVIAMFAIQWSIERF